MAGPLAARLRAALGDGAVLSDPSDIAGYAEDWRHLYRGQPLAVVRPSTVEQTAATVRICAGAGAPVVPQGGNTSMVGGATPSGDGTAVVLSLERLRAIRAIDLVAMTMTVEAGLTLRQAQEAAEAAGLLLPLSIGSEGSAQIGGVLATNAGGNNTLRFGNAREMVLGLEVVLADGTVWDGLRQLHKDNTGYSLRQLFVGSEGTLGVITAAVLRLQPGVTGRIAAFCALPSVDAALVLLNRLRAWDAAGLHAFEYMSGQSLDLVLRHIEGAQRPVAGSDHYVLIELATGGDAAALAGLESGLEGLLAAAMEEGAIADAALSRSEAQRLAFRRLREEHSEAQKRAGASIKNDVSVPIAAIPELLRAAEAACIAAVPGIRVAPFGHLGDGNIHLNLVQPEAAEAAGFLARSDELMHVVNTVVRDLGGSFSAEHGVGRLKTGLMEEWRGGPELRLMRAIKAAIDPAGIFNPGVIFPPG
ncbi:MAG: FAD-binding oxidoreductase [Proteobacteria bacterium]|nr:FAD-binding oxidoreductase [Pseudomonadota bacterium]